MGRELSSFIDLQKTLGQLGFNNGSVALRLKFHPTNIPLEEAMEQIGNYFKSADYGNHNVEPSQSSASVQSTPGTPLSPEPEPSSPPSGNELRSQSPSKTPLADIEPLTSSSPSDFTGIGPGQRQISVTAPPSSSTPYAALQEYNERDYIPTTEDVLRHQARLSQSGRNQRLKTDAEITAELKAQNEKSAAVQEVEIKVRFPDQTCVNTKFSNLDTATSLFDFVQGLLEDGEEEFLLNFISAAGPKTIPKDDKVKLIGREGLDMKGRLLVNVIWAEGTSVKARQGQFLKAEVKAQAKEIQIPKIEEQVVTEQKNRATLLGEPQGPGGKGKGKGLPKWLKGLPGKK